MSTALPSVVVVLASRSPDRLKLLRQIGIEPRVLVSSFEENLPRSLPPKEFVERTAEGKLDDVLKGLQEEKSDFDVVIASDTMISLDEEVIGKPRDAEEAKEVLGRLSGRSHSVFTGVALAFRSGRRVVFHEVTQVTFRKLDQAEIHRYVSTGEPLERAGFYAIQLRGAALVSRISGCYSNIVGLPLAQLSLHLEQNGIPLF